METKHTPGPWTTSRDAVSAGHVQITVYAEETGMRVATVFEREANARLIAAAPDLLVALIDCVSMLEAIQAEDPEDWRAAPYLQMQQAQAAIHKATGG